MVGEGRPAEPAARRACAVRSGARASGHRQRGRRERRRRAARHEHHDASGQRDAVGVGRLGHRWRRLRPSAADRRGRELRGLSTYCNGLSAISMYKALGAVEETYEFVVAAGGGGLAGQVVAVTASAGAGLVMGIKDTLPPFGTPISFPMANWAMCTGLFGISFPPYPLPNTTTIWDGLKPKLKQWVAHPPDPAFATVAQPDPVDVDALGFGFGFGALGVTASDIADVKTLDRVRALQ